MTAEGMRCRTSALARNVFALTTSLMVRIESRDVALQLRRSAASVAANYRAATRARSHREFTSRLSLVLEEADETQHWLAFVDDCRLAPGQDLGALRAEIGELVAILTVSVRTARAKDRRRKN